MHRTFLALSACALTLTGCGLFVIDESQGQPGDGAAGSESAPGTPGDPGGTPGDPGPAACAPGDHFLTFGASGDDGATLGVAADLDGVYWTNDNGSVWRAGPGGTSPAPIAKGITAPSAIAVDADRLYVVDYPSALLALDKKGGAPEVLATGGIVSVAVGPGGVYFSGSAGVGRAGEPGEPAEILSPLPNALSIAADEAFVYAKATGNAMVKIMRVPLSGGPPEEIAPQEVQSYSYFNQEMAVDDAGVYWLNSSEGTLKKAPKKGGDVITLAAGLADPMSLTVDHGEVYFTVRGKDGGPLEDRAVAKVPAEGGPITYLAHGASTSAFGIAVDATTAYWTSKVVGGPVAAACR